MIKLFAAEAGEIGSISEFEWSEEEKVWPFEKDSDGNTLYCKEIITSLPNNGIKNVAHGIDVKEIHLAGGFMRWNQSLNNISELPLVSTTTLANQVSISMEGTNVTFVTGTNRTAHDGVGRIIYSKN